MDTTDEIPLEDHRFFWARLDDLENRNPALLLSLIEERNLTKHLRDVTRRAMLALGRLMSEKNVPRDQAEELVMKQIVADPLERSRLHDPASRRKLRMLLKRYKDGMPKLPRTYLSQSGITE